MQEVALDLVLKAKDLASKDIDGVADKVEDSNKRTAESAKKVGVAMAAVGVGITAFAKSATDFTVDLVKDTKKLARETGATEEEASRLLYVTRRLGIEGEDTSQMFGIFSKQVAKAGDANSETAAKAAKLRNEIEGVKIEIKKTNDEIAKNGDKTGELRNKVEGLNLKLGELEGELNSAGDAFSKLGISVKNADGSTKSFSALLLETADRFKVMPEGAEKTALAMELFGRSGKDLIPVLNLGKDGIEDMMKRADELGLTLNQKTIGAVNRFITSQKDLKDSSDALKIAVGTLTAPVLARFNEGLNNVLQKLIQTEGPVKDVTAGVLAFGGPALTAAGSVTTLGANLKTMGGETVKATAAKGGLIAAVVAVAGATWAYGNAVENERQKLQEQGVEQSNTIMGLGTLQAQLGVARNAWDWLRINVFNHRTEAEKLNEANNRLKASQDAVKLAVDQHASAELAKRGADLQVEQSQEAYNQAVAQYGPNSLQARQAAYNLQVAQFGQKNASDQLAGSTQNVKNKHQELANSAGGVRGAIDSIAGAANRQKDSFNGLVGSIGRYISEMAKATLTKFANFRLPGMNAEGTNYWRGGLTWVGEQGPELINAPKGTRILSNENSMKLLKNSSDSMPAGGGGQVINFNGDNHFYTAEAVDAFFNIADTDATLNSKGFTPTRGN